MPHCTSHSFEIICRGWKVGLADHMMRSFSKIVQLFDTIYHISTTFDILRLFGSVVRALDFYPGGPGSNPIRDMGFFSNYASFFTYKCSYS